MAPGAGAPGEEGKRPPDWIIRDGTKRRSQRRTTHSIQRGQAASMERMERFKVEAMTQAIKLEPRIGGKRQEAQHKSIRVEPSSRKAASIQGTSQGSAD